MYTQISSVHYNTPYLFTSYGKKNLKKNISKSTYSMRPHVLTKCSTILSRIPFSFLRAFAHLVLSKSSD